MKRRIVSLFLVLMLLTRANQVLPMDMRLAGKKEE